MHSTQELKQVFVEDLGIDPATDADSIVYGQTQGWDSTAHMGLVAGIENRFDIMLDTQDLIDMSSFRKATEILGKYGVSFDA